MPIAFALGNINLVAHSSISHAAQSLTSEGSEAAASSVDLQQWLRE